MRIGRAYKGPSHCVVVHSPRETLHRPLLLNVGQCCYGDVAMVMLLWLVFILTAALIRVHKIPYHKSPCATGAKFHSKL